MSELTPLRARFWPRYFRWAITLQLGPLLLFGLNILYRGAGGDWDVATEVFVIWAGLSVVLAALALLVAFRRRNLGCAELTPKGIRPYTLRHGWDFRYAWAVIDTVRVKAGPFGNRWLEVVPDGAPPFKLTARPSDSDAVLEALEEYAGPDHPLTQAYHALTPTA